MCNTKWCSGECDSCIADKELEEKYNEDITPIKNKSSDCTFPMCGCPHFMC